METPFIYRIYLAFMILTGSYAFGQAGEPIYLELRIYHFENNNQEKRLDHYFKEAFIPALHAYGIKQVGAFKPRDGQPGADSSLYILIPHESLKGIEDMRMALTNDNGYQNRSKAVLQASYKNPAYDRMELILMRAFKGFPKLGVPEIATEPGDRIYELRSYESATEFLYRRKVAMFNEGEADIFVRLGFQPVFFGDVISGTNMPRLIYMTTHANEEEQAEHWKAFRSDPKWDEMKGMDRYANTVSHIEKYMLYPTEYSDL